MITDYQKTVNHIFETYEKKFSLKYPFKAVDGKIVKWMVGNYGKEITCCLWDCFLELKKDRLDYKDKQGMIVERGYNLRVFQSKVSDLIEEGKWKDMIVTDNNLKIDLKKITPQEDSQSNKVDSLKKLEDLSL